MRRRRTPRATPGRRHTFPPSTDVALFTIRADLDRLTFICSGCRLSEFRARGIVDLIRARRHHVIMHLREGFVTTW